MKNIDSLYNKDIRRLPNGWKNYELNDVTNITRLAGAEYSDLWETKENGEIIALRGQNIRNGKLVLKDVDRISNELSNRLIRSKLFKDDIVFPCVGSIGEAYVVNENDKYHINQNIAKLSVKSGNHPQFIAYYLMSEKIKKEIIKYNTSSSQPNVLVGNLRKFEILIPPKKEQQKIASILSTWDKAIELKVKLIDKKKEQKKGLMQKLITGEVRLSGFTDVWMKKKVGDLIVESKEIAKNPDLRKRITVKLNLKGIEQRGFSSVEKEGATTQYLRKKEQFIYGKQNLHKGAFGIIPEELDGFQSSSDIPAFDFKQGVDPYWFYYYLARESYFKSLERLSTGTGSKRISPKEFLNLSIKVPPLAEQKAISKVLQTLDKEIELLTKEHSSLKLQKKGLMQLLLTGKVRVEV